MRCLLEGSNMSQFQEAGLSLPLIRSLERMGFTSFTPIQAAAIPPALTGRDIMGTASTGSGKTVAFGVPLVESLLANPRGSALVLTPTRELAVQVIQVITKLIGDTKIPTALLIGGEPMPKQFQQLRARPRLVVGTPGRINDHLERGTLMLHHTHFLVLDETDRMLDMGFGIQLEAIAKYLTAKRQTLMFSATLPRHIINLSAKYLTDPLRISVDGSNGEENLSQPKITQTHIKVSEAEKYERLLAELEKREGTAVVFVKTKFGAEKLSDRLSKSGVRSDSLHGDLRQSRRDRVIDGFRKQKYRVLVATDIAARGLDIPHIALVINYDPPQSPEDYVHRIGRTARAGAEGEALNLISPQEGAKWRAARQFMGESGASLDIANDSRGRGAGGRSDRRRGPGGRSFGSSENRSEGRSNSGYQGRRSSSSDAPRSAGGYRPQGERRWNADSEAKPDAVAAGDSPRRERSDRPQRSSEGRSDEARSYQPRSARPGEESRSYRPRGEGRGENSGYQGRRSSSSDAPRSGEYRPQRERRWNADSEAKPAVAAGDSPRRERSDRPQRSSEGRSDEARSYKPRGEARGERSSDRSARPQRIAKNGDEARSYQPRSEAKTDEAKPKRFGASVFSSKRSTDESSAAPKRKRRFFRAA